MGHRCCLLRKQCLRIIIPITKHSNNALQSGPSLAGRSGGLKNYELFRVTFLNHVIMYHLLTYLWGEGELAARLVLKLLVESIRIVINLAADKRDHGSSL